jgi:hypothetical protein
MSTVNEDSWFGTPVNKNKDYVSADINKALIYAKIIDDNTTLVKIIVNADPHIDYIPQRLINWGLKNCVGVFMRYIARKTKNLPEEYKKLMEEKKEYY